MHGLRQQLRRHCVCREKEGIWEKLHDVASRTSDGDLDQGVTVKMGEVDRFNMI